MKMKNQTIAIFATSLIALSCTKTPPTPTQPTEAKGVYIANEGLFQTGVGTVSLYNPEDKSTSNELFLTQNGFPLGNVLQSIEIEANSAYLLLNNSGKIEVAGKNDMASITTITGFTSPRYLKVIDANTAYVSDWFANNLKVVDLKSLSIIDSIATGTGPERMAVAGNNRVFVTNTGGWSTDSTVTVINEDGAVDSTLKVGYLPNSIQVDKNGMVWVLCAGIIDWADPTNDVAGSLYQIDPNTLAITKMMNFPSNTMHPSSLQMNSAGDELFFLSDLYAGSVFKMSITDTNVPSFAFINQYFYSLGIDPSNGDIYGGDPLDYNQAGLIYRFDSNGQFLDSARVGVIPVNFTFAE